MNRLSAYGVRQGRSILSAFPRLIVMVFPVHLMMLFFDCIMTFQGGRLIDAL